MRVLKKLFLGDVVAKGTTRQLRKLTTEKPQEESIIGTWVFNENVDFSMLTNLYDRWHIDFISSDVEFDSLRANKNDSAVTYEQNLQNYYSAYTNGEWRTNSLRTIIINGGDDVNNATFVNWLKANATKQESIVGTWRFNDTLSSENFVSVGVTKQYTGDPLNEDDILFYFTQDNGVVLYCTGMKKLSSGSICCTQYSSGGAQFLFPYNFSDNTFQKDYCKTITFVKDVKSTSFINWLKANATKIA